MKKLLVLFLFAGLVFSTTSCKKEESCPEPEKRAPGTWKVTRIVINQDEKDLNDPAWACYAQGEMTLNKTQDGDSWDFYYYDTNASSCEVLNLNVTSWAENLGKNMLYVTNTDGQNVWNDAFKYQSEDVMRYLISGNETYFEFTRQ